MNSSVLRPSVKANCFVQIFLNPLPCTTISSKLIKRQQRWTGFIRHFDTDMYPILDHRFSKGAYSFDATKCCVFYIHVELHKPEWIYHLENIRRGLVHYEQLWNQFGDLNGYMFVNPSRIVFLINHSTEMKPCKITLKVVIGCNDFHSYFDHVQLHCKRYLNFKSELGKCIRKADEEKLLLATVVNFDNSPNDQQVLKQVKKKLLKSSHLP